MDPAGNPAAQSPWAARHAPPTIGRDFLQPVARRLQKMKLYAMHRDGLIEDQTDLLLALLRRTPA